jgi:hypothetical protein
MDTTKIKTMIDLAITQLENARSMIDSEIPKPPKEALDKAKQEVCLACGKKYTERSGRPVRGLHNACWTKIKRMMEAGDATEDDLINRGMLLPAQPGGRKAEPFPYEQFLSSGLSKVAEPPPEETKPDPNKDPKPRKRNLK